MSGMPDPVVVVIEQEAAPIVIEVGLQGPAGASGTNHVSGMIDVVVTDIVDGSILIWDANEQKWVAQNALRNILHDGGNF